MFVYPLTRTVSRASLSAPFGRAVDEAFDRFVGQATGTPAVRTPAIDVAETDQAYLLSVDLPGVAREQLKVSIDGRRVSIESVDVATLESPPAAEGEPAAAPAQPRPLYRERSTARYARKLSLPAEVDQAASQAKFDNGVLTLTLVKKVPTGATQLKIG